MATTPEGQVKKKVKKVLDKYDGSIYVRMNVPSGFGKPGLDFEGAICGRAFAIETKAPGNVPTPRQERTISEMHRGGIAVFVVIGDNGLEELDAWLERWT